MAEPPQCRFCLGDAGDDDELVAPCECRGGQRWVHLACLRRWQRSILVTQPTHPALIQEDRRMTHCQVCLAKLTCPALSRHEMMLQFTGQELASLVREQSLISSSQAWSDALFHHLRRVADRRSINNFVHWSRSSYLIYYCGPKQLALSIPDEANREAVLDNLDSAGHLEIQGKQYRLLREGPLAPSSPPSEPTTDVADVSSPSLFQAISALQVPTEVNLQLVDDSDRSDDSIRAVNLSKAISEEDLSVEVQLLLRRAMKAAKIDSLPRVQHFLAGPCATSQCLVMLPSRDGNADVPGFKAFPSLGIALGRDLAAALRPTAPPAAPAATEPSAPSPAPEPEPPVAEPVAKRQRVETEEVAEDTGTPEAHEPEEDVASASASEFSDFWGLTADVAPDLPDDDGSGSDGSALLEGPDAADMVVSVAAESIYDVAGSMRIEGTEGAEPTLRIFWGEARWQRTQLLGELARGDWGLCQAAPADLQRSARSLWRQLLDDERPVYAPRSEMTRSECHIVSDGGD